MDHNNWAYMTTVAQRKPSYTSAKQLLDKVAKVASESVNIQPMVVFETFSLKKVLAVPNEATAFDRRRVRLATFIMRWTQETAGNLEFARKSVVEMKEILKANQPSDWNDIGYGNTGS